MRKWIALFAFAALTACGVDGEPITPTASIGVGVGDSGVRAGGAVGIKTGPLSVRVSVF